MRTNPISNIPEWMIIDSIRYCIGRMSYQVGVTTRWIIDNWCNIDDYTKEIVKRDVETEFKADDRARENGFEYNPLGHDCDRQAWSQVRLLWS